jgi:hypothetical protein
MKARSELSSKGVEKDLEEENRDDCGPSNESIRDGLGAVHGIGTEQ